MNTLNSSPRADIYSRVTTKVLADLENGVRTWLKPWSGDVDATRVALPLRHNGIPYRGINVLLLWSEAIDKGYSGQRWMTYRQAVELGGHVRKGEHGLQIVYADSITRTEANEQGEAVERDIPFLKQYTVFNVVQIENLPDEYYAKAARRGTTLELIAEAERFFAATRAVVRHGGNKAYYAPGPDVIQLPEPEAFRDSECYVATKAHELTHWSSHSSRLARNFGAKRFGDDGYAVEELVAASGCALAASFANTNWDPTGVRSIWPLAPPSVRLAGQKTFTVLSDNNSQSFELSTRNRPLRNHAETTGCYRLRVSSESIERWP